jgi:hypothetical protein
MTPSLTPNMLAESPLYKPLTPSVLTIYLTQVKALVKGGLVDVGEGWRGFVEGREEGEGEREA